MQIFVNQHRRQTEDGTRERPFGTIGQAAAAAMPGDEVIVFPGVYRERVQLPRGGSDSAHPIVYRSFLPRGAVLSGAEILTGWESMGEGLYRAPVPDALYDGPVPCPEGSAAGAVFRNGQPLRKAGSPETLAQEKDSWCIIREAGAVFVWVNPGGPDPRRDLMELAVRSSCFSPASAETGFITLSGFRLEKTGGPVQNPENPQAVLCAGSGSGWIIEDCEIRHGTGNGILADGRGVTGPDPLLIRECEIHGCGQAGIAGRGTGPVSIENCHIHHIGPDDPASGRDAAGIRLQDTALTRISGCQIHHCAAGLSLEHGIRNVLLTGSCLHQNGSGAPAGQAGADLRLESSGRALISGSLFLSERSCRMAGPSVDFSHSLFVGSFPEAGKDCRFSDNICFEKAGGPCTVQYGSDCMTLAGAGMEILGDEGRWVLRTSLYQLLAASGPERCGQTAESGRPAASLPGPFPDGTPGAWILKPGSLP